MKNEIKNIVLVQKYTNNKNEEKKKYTTLGSAFFKEFTNKETGEIFETINLNFELFPTDHKNGFIQIMARKEN